MKINRLEAHDRLEHLKKDQSANIFKGASDCLTKNPLSLAIQEKSPYVYIFAHPRTADNGVDKVMYWQPRLSLPIPQTNSYLFRALSKTDILETIWMIPPKEHWHLYEKDYVLEHNVCCWSIAMFELNRKFLEKPHAQDLSEDQAKHIMKSIIDEHRQKLKMDKMYETKMD